MVSEDILSYIKKAKSQNTSEEQIINALHSAGWDAGDIKQALSTTGVLPVPTPPDVPKPKKSAPSTNLWDVFEHVLMFIGLYVLATSLALAVHAFIDKYFPSVSQGGYSYTRYYDSYKVSLLRGYIAALIVSYPVFSSFFLHVTKRTMGKPALRELKSRKLLIYLTLVTTLIILLSKVIISEGSYKLCTTFSANFEQLKDVYYPLGDKKYKKVYYCILFDVS